MGPHPVPTPSDIGLKLSPLRPLANCYLHTKFERDRIKMTELSNQKADERITVIIEKRQNKNIKVCRRRRADLNNKKQNKNRKVFRLCRLCSFMVTSLVSALWYGAAHRWHRPILLLTMVINKNQFFCLVPLSLMQLTMTTVICQ